MVYVIYIFFILFLTTLNIRMLWPMLHRKWPYWGPKYRKWYQREMSWEINWGEYKKTNVAHAAVSKWQIIYRSVYVMSHDLYLCSVLNSSLLEQSECVQKLRTYIGSHVTEKKEEEELRRQIQVCKHTVCWIAICASVVVLWINVECMNVIILWICVYSI